MYKSVDKEMHRKIDEIDFYRRLNTLLISYALIVFFVYLILFSWKLATKHIIVISIYITVILLVIFIICFSSIRTSTIKFADKKLYYCLGVCTSKVLIMGGRSICKSRLTITPDDNHVLDNISVIPNIVDNCETGELLLLIFDEESFEVPSKIYRVDQSKPGSALHRW